MTDLKFMVYNEKYLYAYASLHDGKLRYPTGIKIAKQDFDNGIVPPNITKKINRLIYLFDQYVLKQDKAMEPVYLTDVIPMLDEALFKKKKNVRSTNVIEMFRAYLLGIEKGDILNDGKKYGESKIRLSNQLIVHLVRTNLKSVEISKLNTEHIEYLKAYLISLKHSQNSIHNAVALFLAFIRHTKRLKWHNNTVGDEEGLNVGSDKIDYTIALKPSEIDVLCSAATTWIMKKYQDVFKFGCNVGLRYGDVQSLTPENEVDGVLLVDTQKTGAIVHVPLNKAALEIWREYNGKLPRIKRHAMCVGIRQIAEKTKAFDTPMLFSRVEGGVKVKIYKEKYKLISTHTMRRSFATNAYLAGVPILSIMKITGHKTTESFMKYIRISHAESADLVKGHEFFK